MSKQKQTRNKPKNYASHPRTSSGKNRGQPGQYPFCREMRPQRASGQRPKHPLNYSVVPFRSQSEVPSTDFEERSMEVSIPSSQTTKSSQNLMSTGDNVAPRVTSVDSLSPLVDLNAIMSRRHRRGVTTWAPKLPKHYNNMMPMQYGYRQRVVTTFVLTAAAPQINKLFNPNNLYVPETGGGSGATPGFADFAALYGYYRVIGYSYTVVVSNNEAFPVTFFALETNNNPTTGNTSALASNRNSATFQLSAKGGQDRVSYHRPYISICEIVGSSAPLTDDLYVGGPASSPSDQTWNDCGVQSIGGANLTLGISGTHTMDQYAVWYDPLLQI